MENSEKNSKIDKRLENLRPNMGRFKTAPQPSPELKKEGWARRKEAQLIMDTIKKYSSLSFKELSELLDDVKAHPEKYTVNEIRLMNYVAKTTRSDKFLLDWIDRNVSKAPQDLDIKSGGEKITSATIKIVTANGNRNRSDDSLPEDPRSV